MSGPATAPQGVTASQPSCFDGCPSRRALFSVAESRCTSFLVANRDPSTSLGMTAVIGDKSQ